MDENNNDQTTPQNDQPLQDGAQPIEVKTDNSSADMAPTDTVAPVTVDNLTPPPSADSGEEVSNPVMDQTEGAPTESIEVKQPPAEAGAIEPTLNSGDTTEMENSSEQPAAGMPTEAMPNNLDSMSSTDETSTQTDVENGATESLVGATAAAGIDQTTSETNTQADNSMQNHTETPKPENKNNKKFAIFVIIIVAILLSVVAVYLYVTAVNNTEETNTETEQSSTEQNDQATEPVDTSPATPSDVDGALQEAEEAINQLDDTSDFSEESLSDDALGL